MSALADMKNEANFEFLETTDPLALSRYVELRRRVFRGAYEWLPEDFGGLDEYDLASRIVLATHDGDGRVVGGGRLTISFPSCPVKLPLEKSANVSLLACDYLQHLALSVSPYAEISRMAVDPSCAHGRKVSFGLGDKLCEVAAAAGIDTVFCICPDGPARLNEWNAKRRGVTFRKYRSVATDFGHEMWLCAFEGIRQVYTPQAKGEGPYIPRYSSLRGSATSVLSGA